MNQTLQRDLSSETKKKESDPDQDWWMKFRKQTCNSTKAGRYNSVHKKKERKKKMYVHENKAGIK